MYPASRNYPIKLASRSSLNTLYQSTILLSTHQQALSHGAAFHGSQLHIMLELSSGLVPSSLTKTVYLPRCSHTKNSQRLTPLLCGCNPTRVSASPPSSEHTQSQTDTHHPSSHLARGNCSTTCYNLAITW